MEQGAELFCVRFEGGRPVPAGRDDPHTRYHARALLKDGWVVGVRITVLRGIDGDVEARKDALDALVREKIRSAAWQACSPIPVAYYYPAPGHQCTPRET